VTSDNWKVTQAPSCAATLTTASITAKVFEYDASETTTTVYTSSEIFTNSKAAACPITSCTVTQGGGSTALVDPFDSLISIRGFSPTINLVVSQTAAVGYPDVTVRVSCTNSVQTLTHEVTLR